MNETILPIKKDCCLLCLRGVIVDLDRKQLLIPNCARRVIEERGNVVGLVVELEHLYFGNFFEKYTFRRVLESPR